MTIRILPGVSSRYAHPNGEIVMRPHLFPAMLALVLASAPLHAQETSAPSGPPAAPHTGEKSVATARLLGILPGAGHMYAGEVGRGFAYLGGTVGLAALGGIVLVGDCFSDGDWLDPNTGEDCGSDGVEAAVTIAVLGFWGWSIYDAGRAARRTNAKRRMQTALILEPTLLPTAGRDYARGARIGLSIPTR